MGTFRLPHQLRRGGQKQTQKCTPMDLRMWMNGMQGGAVVIGE
jgi:hypothetical protein